MPRVTLIYGDQQKSVQAPAGSILGDAIIRVGLPFGMPCAGRGSCGLCKVLSEGGLEAPDEIERKHLSEGELAVGTRLACRARLAGDAQIILAPVSIFSDKIFRQSGRYQRDRDVPLGIAVDLGSTTVAAFLTMLDDGEVCAGGAVLNQQRIYGADVISRLAAAMRSEADAERLRRLALSSVNQAVDSLKLSPSVRRRIERVAIVGNPAMHHLLLGLPVENLAVMPFQPACLDAIADGRQYLQGIFPESTRISFPPLIGGFVGSDALACLAYFDFDKADVPLAAVDLGTNGEVMVTDGKRILVTSTAAGPAFEGVNISCGTRAIPGAITGVAIDDGAIVLETIENRPAVGLTGSGLLSAIACFVKAGWVEPNGRIAPQSPRPKDWREKFPAIPLTKDGKLVVTQWDIRELQKAKGAVRAAIDILLDELGLVPGDLSKIILTGSFGGGIDVDTAVATGLLPPVDKAVIESVANGAGLGAAQFLMDDGFSRSIRIAHTARHIDLDTNARFIDRYVAALSLGRF